MRTVALREALAPHPERVWGRRLRLAPAQMITSLREWRRRSRSRGELARFDARMLADIGLTRVDAWVEINKPFWRE